jgi:membrane-associated protease RseP (regulator of RpoE activity)
MSAPKHLWSGDWEQDSAAVSEQLAGLRSRPAAPEPPRAPEPRPARPKPTRRRFPARQAWARLRPVLPLVLAVALILAAGAYGLSRVMGSAGQPPSATAGPSGGEVRWLGMQIDSVNPGTVVIETVAPGSPAEQAGLEPGDVILQVAGHSIDSTSQIGPAVTSLQRGAYVGIQVSRGSTVVNTQAVLSAPPSQHP